MPITKSAFRECQQSGAPPTIDAKVESHDIDLALNLTEQFIDRLQATISALWARLAPITEDPEPASTGSAAPPHSGLCPMSRRIYAAADAVASSSGSLEQLNRLIQL